GELCPSAVAALRTAMGFRHAPVDLVSTGVVTSSRAWRARGQCRQTGRMLFGSRTQNPATVHVPADVEVARLIVGGADITAAPCSGKPVEALPVIKSRLGLARVDCCVICLGFSFVQHAFSR